MPLHVGFAPFNYAQTAFEEKKSQTGERSDDFSKVALRYSGRSAVGSEVATSPDVLLHNLACCALLRHLPLFAGFAPFGHAQTAVEEKEVLKLSLIHI